MRSYVGIGPEQGKRIEEDFALGYAMQRVMQDPEEQKAFVEWFYSGNWTKSEEEPCMN